MHLLRPRKWRRHKQLAFLSLSGSLVGFQQHGFPRYVCIQAQLRDGRPIYIAVSRREAASLARTLTHAAGRDSAYWGDEQWRGSAPRPVPGDLN